MSKQQSNKKMISSGFAVMEIYNAEFPVPKNLKGEFEKNPEKMLRDFLKKGGKKVNSLIVVPRPSEKAPRPVPPGLYHFVYPKEVASTWVYIPK